MLESLRAIQNTWIGKSVVAIIMGLIMISFVIWGIGPVFTGFNANTLASVGNDSVTVDAFRQAYQSELQQLQQRARRPISNAEAHRYGIDTQVLSRLVSDAVLDNQARGLGLAISQDQIAKAITSDPTFAGPNGQFDHDRFNELLRENDMNEQMFVREQRNVYLRQELVQGMVGGLTAPQAAVDALHALQTETRSIDYVALPPAAAGDIPPPDEATLQKFFDDRASTFRAPEYRKLVILPILPATVAKPEDVSAADVQALYDRSKDTRFTTPETRALQQIVFPTEEEARAALASIKAGKTFAELADERKLTTKDIDLGTTSKDSAYDKGVADAAFALPDNGVSEPVKTAFGSALVHVTAITPGAVKPLSEVEPALRLEIASGRTGDAIRTLHDKVEDARASGQSLTEAAKAAGLPVETAEIDAAGLGKDGKPVTLPDDKALVKAAFASDVGVDNEALRPAGGGQIFFEVAAIEPARAKTLAEVKPAVEAAWHSDEVAQRLRAKAEELVKAIDAGKSLEEIAASNGGLAVSHAGDVRRAGGDGLPAAMVAQVFNTPVLGAGSAAGTEGSRLIFKVLGTLVPALDADSPATKQIVDQYKSALADELLTTYLSQVQSRLGVKINPAAFAAATGGT